VVAIIPAHNEQDGIAVSIGSLSAQTRPADSVIVIIDNCTDQTRTLAWAAGADVVDSVDNTDRKAGALNLALAEVLKYLDEDDAVLMMDADTTLSPRFLEHALPVLSRDARGRRVGGVGGIFTGDRAKWSLVRQIQQNEYVRYARHLGRRRGRALVLTGTGTLFNVGALRAVVRARQSRQLPDHGGTRGVYDTHALTEDNELTLSLKSLGYAAASPRECVVETAMMPTLRSLFIQRIRWQRGALENIKAHGLHSYIFPYAVKQFLTYLGVIFLPLYLTTLAVQLARPGHVNWLVPLWLIVALVYFVEQAWSVRRGGWRAVATSLAALPEIFYLVFLDVVYVVALASLISRKREEWGAGHRRPATAAEAAEAEAANAADPNRPRPAWVGYSVLLIALLVALSIPFISLQLAWWMLAVYVLCGFAATVFRLVPLPMS
jgi:cellulose synthase/poly-beta-1,6-N-acetylglucosamine synthase-like glycosyltransferase